MNNQFQPDKGLPSSFGKDNKRIVVSHEGLPCVTESGLKHRSGFFLRSMTVKDSVGGYVYSTSTDIPSECKMAREVKTVQRDVNDLPVLIRENQLGENLTEGITRMLTDQIFGERESTPKYLSQKQVALNWNEKKQLTSVTDFVLASQSMDKEYWEPQGEHHFEYDQQGRIIRKTEYQYSEDGHSVRYYYEMEHEQIDDVNIVTSKWYTNDNVGVDEQKNQLNLHTLDVEVYDRSTHDRLALLNYHNTQITSAKPFLGSTEPVLVIKPENGEKQILDMKDVKKLKDEKNFRVAKLLGDGKIPLSINATVTLDLSKS